ncbi:hypothetical protein C9439_03305 [archaeon SCG-AAA382B04]|nr:hypothetical protein C9439_03305 [archaeon SCG-AAA382B04]
MSETSSGLDENIAGALAYLLGLITGIILLLIEKDNEFVRFHAAQSIVVFAAIFVINIILSVISGGIALGVGGLVSGVISMIIGLLSLLIMLITFILWVYLMFTAYKGNKTRIPVAAGIADDLV